MLLTLMLLLSSISTLYACDPMALRVQAVAPAKAALLLLEKEKMSKKNGDERSDDTAIMIDGSGSIQLTSHDYEKVSRDINYVQAVELDCWENYSRGEPFHGHLFKNLLANPIYAKLNEQEKDALRMLCESWVNMKIYYEKNPSTLNAATIESMRGLVLALSCNDRKEFEEKDVFEYSDWTREFVWYNSRVMLLKMERDFAEASLEPALRAYREGLERGETKETIRAYAEKRALDLLKESDEEQH